MSLKLRWSRISFGEDLDSLDFDRDANAVCIYIYILVGVSRL